MQMENENIVDIRDFQRQLKDARKDDTVAQYLLLLLLLNI